MEIITVDDEECKYFNLNIVELLNNDQVKIDFKMLYQCLHIYDYLKMRDEFLAEFSDIRKTQASNFMGVNLVLKDNLSQFEGFLHVVAGFFIMEDYFVNSPINFYTKSMVIFAKEV